MTVPTSAASGSARIQLLVIDPQNDFCDLPAAWQMAQKAH